MRRHERALQIARHLVVLAIFLALAAYAFVAAHGRLPRAAALEMTPWRLPSYLGWSFLRMTVAYFASLVFAVFYGYTAATSRRAERVMMPVLDILQSVPVLGFFPAATALFVDLAPGRLGLELASIFLIFTSQAWNMAFGVYEAITTIPQDSLDAMEAFGLSGLRRFRLLYLPASVPKLVYNSILSWAGGWYFLIACEIISVGPMARPLPGLGAFLKTASDQGRTSWILIGIAFLIAVVVLMDLIIWRPLGAWAEKFRYEFAASTVSRPSGLGIWRHSRPGRAIRAALHHVVRVLDEALDRLSAPTPRAERSRAWRAVGRVTAVALIVATSYVAFRAVSALMATMRWPWPREAALIPLAILASFTRLLVAYLIALAWTLPLAAWAADRPRALRVVEPLAEIAASVPATALFPLIVAVVVRYLGGMEVASVLLVLTGMQWYLLMNLLAGARQIPGDLKEATRSFGVRGLRYFRSLLLPAMTPSLVTGSITGWGGGWNALIVSEYLVFEGRTMEVFGIGAMLDHATWGGPAQMTVLTLVSLVAVVVLTNRFFWRRAYARAADRYKVEY